MRTDKFLEEMENNREAVRLQNMTMKDIVPGLIKMAGEFSQETESKLHPNYKHMIIMQTITEAFIVGTFSIGALGMKEGIGRDERAEQARDGFTSLSSHSCESMKKGKCTSLLYSPL